jgi:hypothetical protein
MITRTKKWLVILLALAFVLSAGIASAQVTVTSGSNSSAQIKAQLKYRELVNPKGLNGYDGVLGVPVSSYPYYNPAQFLTFGYSDPGWASSNHVVLNYNGSGTLTATVNAEQVYTLTVDTGSLGTINYLQFDVVNRATGTTVNFNNVKLNGTLLPTSNFTGSGWSTWQVTGINLTSDFNILGDLDLAWPETLNGGQETNKLVISLGYIPPAPPDCSEAYPSVDNLWPPNHELWPVKILGVTGNDVSITIDSIYQDEPVDSTGDGEFVPDGQGLGTDTAQVRAERDGDGNGRVYHIHFTATNDGGSCQNEVLVTVPKSKGKNGAAVDDGADYDSTSP